MAITKSQEVMKRNILRDGQIEVRVDTVFTEDGEEVGRTHNDYVLAPGGGVDGQPAQIVKTASNEWTPEVVAAFREAFAARKAKEKADRVGR